MIYAQQTEPELSLSLSLSLPLFHFHVPTETNCAQNEIYERTDITQLFVFLYHSGQFRSVDDRWLKIVLNGENACDSTHRIDAAQDRRQRNFFAGLLT